MKLKSYEKYLTLAREYAKRCQYAKERAKPRSNVFPAWTLKRKNEWHPSERQFPCSLKNYVRDFERLNSLKPT